MGNAPSVFTVVKWILKSDYNHGFKNFTNRPKLHLLNSSVEIKSKTYALFEPATLRLLTYTLTELRGKFFIYIIQMKLFFRISTLIRLHDDIIYLACRGQKYAITHICNIFTTQCAIWSIKTRIYTFYRDGCTIWTKKI